MSSLTKKKRTKNKTNITPTT